MRDRDPFQMMGKDVLIFNAQKFHIDDPNDLALYHKVMRKYAGDNVLCSEKYFNKSSELFVYVEWLGEKDFIEEFVRPDLQKAQAAANPAVRKQNMQAAAQKILKVADSRDNASPSE